jgi:molecular chaperone GrpE
MTKEDKNINDNQDELVVLQQELADSQTKAAEYLEGWRRAKADYANVQRDAQKRHEELSAFAKVSFVSDMLPIFENFNQALKHIPKDNLKDDWAIGLGYIKKQFEDFLKNLDIEQIKTVGEKFDPQLHEALALEENPDFETDIIFEEISAGYTLNGRVIVPAKVKVAK